MLRMWARSLLSASVLTPSPPFYLFLTGIFPKTWPWKRLICTHGFFSIFLFVRGGKGFIVGVRGFYCWKGGNTVFRVYTALFLLVLMVSSAVLLAVFNFIEACRRFREWAWRMVASPPVPPWRWFHLGLRRVCTKVALICCNGLKTQVPVTCLLM